MPSGVDSLRVTCRALRRLLAVCLLAAGAGACMPNTPPAENPVADTLARASGPYQVEFRAYAFPDTGEGMNHVTYGLNMGRDGYLYVGIANNRDNGYVYRFDTRAAEFTTLGSFRDALPAEVFRAGNYGKFHVGPYQDSDGAVWVASHPRERWDKAQSGRLFRIDADGRMQDQGPTPGDEGIYFMTGSEAQRKLYLVGRNSHFLTYGLDNGEWKDKGRFSSKAPFIGMFDTFGRLYMYGYDGVGEGSVGPPLITRYDPQHDSLETSRHAPPTLWVGAVTPDGQVAYTTTYERADLYRWSFDEWPTFEAEHLGRIDPRGRAVFSNNLSQANNGELLVVAGTVEPRTWLSREHEHGVWAYAPATGRRWQLALLNEVLSRSLGLASEKYRIYWTNANTVDADGWIWIGISTMPFDESARARLIGIRVTQPARTG